MLFASDQPVAMMRGRRVNVMDHWVDIVLGGYPKSGFRVGSDDIHATFMLYEIVVALNQAAEMAGLSDEQRCAMYYDNGMALLQRAE